MRAALIAFALMLASPVSAGGVVPDGMGAWRSGGRGIIALDTRLLRYRWDSGFDAMWRDRIAFAVADVDREFQTIRFTYALGTCDTPYQIHFDVNAEPAPPECSDDISGNCIVGRTTCSEGGEYVGAGYRVCNMMRVMIYIDRIRAVAAHKGLVESDYAHGIIRHEIGHALGLSEADNIGAQTSACARARLLAYVNDPAIPEWTFVPAPAACL